MLNAYKNIRKYRNYAMGNQDTTLTLDQKKMLEGVLGNEYSDNICGQVLSEHADRLELQRITCEDDKVQKWIDDYWQKLRFDDLQQRVHRNALRDGNFCLMVEYDYEREKIVVHREKWWDGVSGVFIGYDAYGQMLYAVKEWETPMGRRRTVYFDGYIERYISMSGANIWMPYVLPSDGLQSVGNDSPAGKTSVTTGALPAGSEPVAIPYTDEDGEPIHIPFVHFPNVSDEFESYGSSILSGGVVGAQDQINDLQYDMAAAARMTGYQRTWSKGYALKKINGKTVQPKVGPGVHYHANEKDASWGVLQAGEITTLISAYNTKVQSICRMTGTPFNAITGNWPSGEAIYKLEQPIRGKTIARQKRFAPCWVEVMHRCIELANVFDNAGLDETAMLTAVYKDAGDRDPLQLAIADLSFWQAAQAAVASGMPLETFLRVNGWGEDTIKGMSTDIQAQIARNRADLASTAGGTSSGGTAPGTRTPRQPQSPTAGKGSNTKPNNAPGNKTTP